MFQCKCGCGLERQISSIAACSECKHHCLTWVNQTQLEKNTTFCDLNEDPSKLKTLCFQRESLKDQLFVSLFLSITFSLLLFVAFKPFWQTLLQPFGFYRRIEQTNSNSANGNLN